jgi:hypothetical protein
MAPNGGTRTASGSFTMNLRLYWPKPEALDGTPPPVKRLD